MREGWKYKKLGEVCSFINDGDWIESKDQSESGIRLIQTGNIGNGEYKDKGERAKYISEDTFSKLECTEIFKGDCLVSRLPEPIGRCCILPELENRCITAVDCSILRFKTDIIPQLFVYYSQSTKYAIDVENKTTGTTRKRISRKNLEGIQIPIPPKSQQEAIVSELDEINSLLALKREQLQKYDKLAQSLFYEMFGDPIENEKGWEVKKLGEICKFSQGVQIDVDKQLKSPCHGYKKFLRIVDYTTNNDDARYVLNDEKYIIKKEDVAVVRYGASAGSSGIHKEGILANNLFKVGYPREIINYIFLFRYFQSEFYSSFVRKVAFGAAMPALSFSSFGKLPLPLPPLSLQQQFASRIEQIESQKLQVQAAIEKLETLLASRMQYWFE